MRHIARIEQETIINFNEALDKAEIFTYNKKWQRHLEGKLGLVPEEDNGFGGKSYELSKKLIKLPRAKRQISEKEKEKLRARFKATRLLRSKSPSIIGAEG